MEIKAGSGIVPVAVIRSRRKTYEIRITSQGELQFRAPLKMTDKRIREALEERSEWIRRKLEAVRSSVLNHAPRRFATGEAYPFMGKEHLLHIVENPQKARVTVAYETGVFRITAPAHNPEEIRSALEKWCKRQAANILPERVRLHEARMGLKAIQVTVKDQKKRWGSCSSRGNINLNWRLILMPPEVMDAVVIHELAHLVHPNHSAQYYTYLSRYNPAYKEHDKWLKGQGKALFL